MFEPLWLPCRAIRVGCVYVCMCAVSELRQGLVSMVSVADVCVCSGQAGVQGCVCMVVLVLRVCVCLLVANSFTTNGHELQFERPVRSTPDNSTHASLRIASQPSCCLWRTVWVNLDGLAHHYYNSSTLLCSCHFWALQPPSCCLAPLHPHLPLCCCSCHVLLSSACGPCLCHHAVRAVVCIVQVQGRVFLHV